MKLGLEIGPGPNPLPKSAEVTWHTLDAGVPPGGKDGAQYNYQCRWGYGPLPITADKYDIVYGSHVIEHIPWYSTVKALEEAHRIIKPGGSIELWTVDFEKLSGCYNNGQIGDNWRRYNPEGSLVKWLAGRIFAYQQDSSELNWHRAIFDEDHLKECLEHAGFTNCVRLKKPRGYDHGYVNLGMVGTK